MNMKARRLCLRKHSLCDRACDGQAWQFHPEDRVLHVLPLHHIHGIVNAMFTPLCNGATVELQRTFNPAAIWRRLTASPVRNTLMPNTPTNTPVQPASGDQLLLIMLGPLCLISFLVPPSVFFNTPKL